MKNDNQNKKILVVIPKLFHGGGAEKISMEVGSLLSNLGHSIKYFTFHKGDDLKKNIFSLNKKESFPSKLLGIATFPFALKRYCEENDIDIIISHTERANFVSLITKKFFLKDIKIITVTHNFKYLSKLENKIFIKPLYGSSYKNICVSKEIMDKMKKKYRFENILTIYNPFDFKKIRLDTEGKIDEQDSKLFKNNKETFINVGRLHEQKGQKYLIDAFSKYKKEKSNSQLIILGEGHLRKDLENQIDRLGLKDSVLLLGNKRNIFPYIKRSDCFVLSSLWEGLPTVLIEAMATGIPIISTDCRSGPKEIMPDGHKLIKVSGRMSEELKSEMLVYRKYSTEYVTVPFDRGTVSGQWDALMSD